MVLSLVTDELLHLLWVYPPLSEMHAPSLNLLALSYRIVYTVLGSYISARRAPMFRAWLLGIMGFVLGTAGAIVTIKDLGPAWYPIALTALPFGWLGGIL